MHLTKAQEFAFELHCQGYLWYYSHGTSNSTSMGVAVKKSLNIESRKIGEIPGRLLAIELGTVPLRIVNIYAPNKVSSHADFFEIFWGLWKGTLSSWATLIQLSQVRIGPLVSWMGLLSCCIQFLEI